MSGDGISKELIREGNGVMPTKGEQVVGAPRQCLASLVFPAAPISLRHRSFLLSLVDAVAHSTCPAAAAVHCTGYGKENGACGSLLVIPPRPAHSRHTITYWL